MSRKKSLPPLKEDLSPNVVPMIDIMFLLLLFFMLGADMSQRESVEVKLPIADQVKEEKETGGETDPVTTINVHPDQLAQAAIFESLGTSRDRKYWVVSIMGVTYSMEELKKQLKIEGDEFLEDEANPNAGKRLSRKKLLIRAERWAPFGIVQEVIEASGIAGMYKVEIAGSKPTAKT